MTDMDAGAEKSRSAPLGWTGFFAGALALLLALMVFWAGPFAPQPDPVVTPTLAERAVDTAKVLLGGEVAETPVVEAPPPGRNIDEWLRIAVAGLGATAIILGFGGFARRESARPAVSAISLGGGALLFQLISWFALLLVCFFVMGAFAKGGDTLGEVLGGIFEAIAGVFTAIGEFFSNLFGGLFGG